MNEIPKIPEEGRSASGERRQLRGLTKTVTAQVGATSLLQVVATLFDLLFLAILSRLLTPHDYGIVGAAALFLSFCDLLKEVGIGSTVVQLPRLSVKDQRTGFTLVIISGLAIFGFSQAFAGTFAHFMRIVELSDVLHVLSFIILIQAFSTISQGLLIRDLRIGTLMMTEIVSKAIAYSTVGIGLAILGYGYWSLVFASLTDAAIRSVSLAVIARPSMRPSLDRESAKRLLHVGGGFTISRIINFVALRADVTIIGRYMDAASLGLYSRAYKIMSLPNDLYTRVADRVVFPAMAGVQEDRVRLKGAYLKGIGLTALVGIPLTVTIFALSREIVFLLLGGHWVQVIPVFSALALGTYFRLSARVSASLLRAKAAVSQMISSQVFYALATIAASLLAVPYGLVAVGMAISASIIAWYVVISWQTCRITDASLTEFVTAQRHGIYCGAILAAALLPTIWLARENGLHTLVVLIIAGAICAVFTGLMILVRPLPLIGAEGAELAEHIEERVLRLVRRASRR